MRKNLRHRSWRKEASHGARDCVLHTKGFSAKSEMDSSYRAWQGGRVPCTTNEEIRLSWRWMMAIMTKIKRTGHRILSYGFTLVELWFEGTKYAACQARIPE